MHGETNRSVLRALALLRVMNTRPVWTLHELHAATQMPKATLSRLLRSFIEDGCVRSEAPAGTYRLTQAVRELSAGYSETSRLVDYGRPIAVQVTKQIKWPLALGMLDGDSMVVRFSTMPYSPLAVHTTTLGHRLGVFDSAMGRVYLAFAAPEVRKAILTRLGELALGEADSMVPWLLRDLDHVKAEGHALRLPSVERGSATLAVPVLHDGAAIAALSMTTFGKAMTKDIVAQHVPILQDTAARIVATVLAAGEF